MLHKYTYLKEMRLEKAGKISRQNPKFTLLKIGKVYPVLSGPGQRPIEGKKLLTDKVLYQIFRCPKNAAAELIAVNFFLFLCF